MVIVCLVPAMVLNGFKRTWVGMEDGELRKRGEHRSQTLHRVVLSLSLPPSSLTLFFQPSTLLSLLPSDISLLYSLSLYSQRCYRPISLRERKINSLDVDSERGGKKNNELGSGGVSCRNEPVRSLNTFWAALKDQLTPHNYSKPLH